MSDIDEQLVLGLKQAMKEGRVSITALASSTGIPYRTLQNYLSGRTRMSASAYVQICSELGVDTQYVQQGTFHLELAPLYDALWQVFGDALADLKSLPNTSGVEDIERHNRKQSAAHAFAMKISTAYNNEKLNRLSSSSLKRTGPLAVPADPPVTTVPNKSSN